MYRKSLFCLILSLLLSQVALGDYVITSYGVPSVVRFTDDGEIVWETTTDPLSDLEYPSQVEIGPDGDVYVAQGGWGGNRTVKRFDYDTGALLGNVTEITSSDQQNDLQWGYDYNEDGVDDLWVVGRSDLIAVHDGTTLGNYPATLLDSWDIADTDPENQNWDGGGGRGLLFGPDITGDGIGEIFMCKGYNDAFNKINVWDPVALKNGEGVGARVASYPITEIRESQGIILGPDVNGDGQQDLWVASQRRNECRTYDYLTGEELSIENAGITFRNMMDVDHGPDGTVLMVSRFATSLDPDWAGGAEVTGGNVIKYDSSTGVATLVIEYRERIDSVAYIPVDLISAANPRPANESTDISYDTVLSWTPGEIAERHDVYFGTDIDTVSAADRTNPVNVLLSQDQDVNTYDPGRLEFGQTYFWRIDEIEAAGSTIHKGDVWSFTVEPIGYQIPAENIIATASGQAPDQGPDKTIDGSGLNDNDQHSVSLTDMWLTPIAGTVPVWIQYEFDKPYQLHEMLVWNHNGPSILSTYGLKDISIEYSIDGVDWNEVPGASEFAQATGMDSYTYNTVVSFNGSAAKYVKITATDNWSNGMFTQYGLSEVRFLYIPTSAREPNPAHGATDIALDVTLSWRPGREAAEHNVYIGSDEQAVIEGTTDVATVSDTSYGPLDLDLGSVYYWWVDEVNNAETPNVWQGDVWNFSTQEYLVIEDFEDYNDYEFDRIFDTWSDGWDDPANGSTIGYAEPDFPAGEHFVETTIVNSGEQSMPYFYDNTAAGNSEATRPLSLLTDWTRNGIGTLTLWYIGDTANAAEPMYIILNSSVVAYNDNSNAAQATEWSDWNIDLQDFADQGLDLTDVNMIGIGFGDKDNPQPGGSGLVFFDDIRLYHSR